MATTTFTTTAAEDTRMTVAFGTYLGKGRNATAAEIKAWTIDQWKTIVYNEEQKAAQAALTPPTPIAPT
jgi:hypothetical protein